MPNKRQGKWLPFDSLSGHRKSLLDVEEEIEKEEAPILSSDEMEDINQIIIKTHQEKLSVRLCIFEDGRKKELEGIITKIDVANKMIIINKKRVMMEEIIYINLT